jgi:hypothetical protein
LAHGGFSEAVSDVDLGLVIADPVADADVTDIDAISAQMRARRLPLADRLSIFWGSPALLRGDCTTGRFPALDRLDLIRYGRLLLGQEMRAGVPEPTRRKLIVEAAAFALRVLAKPEAMAHLKDADALIAAGVRLLTKRVLFPVRFLYTAETGEVGRNETAVGHYTKTREGPAAQLATSRCKSDG